MNITLKGVKIFQAMSEESTAFVANLYVDGVKTASMKNQGQGGSTYAQLIYNKDLLEAAEKYTASLPPVKSDGMDLKMDLDFYVSIMVDEIVNKKEEEKFQKKLTKLMERSIVVGVPNSGAARCLTSFSVSIPLVIEAAKERFIAAIEHAKVHMKQGEVILNTNIPDELK